MNTRLPKIFCAHCGRSVPRAAIECLWCRRVPHTGRFATRRSGGSQPRPPAPWQLPNPGNSQQEPEGH